MGSSVVDYVISDIPVYNQIVNFYLLNNHEPNSDHRPLTLTLNFTMHKNPLEDNFGNQRHILFDKNKANLHLNDLNIELNLLSYKKILNTSIVILQKSSLPP